MEKKDNKRMAYRLQPDQMDKLNEAAKEQHRSQSAQAAFYIVQGLKRDGFIPSKKGQKP
tara:strand:+ start:680 stop:856 length:177 start_codon:yes stop_codon:yes gene_type:complete